MDTRKQSKANPIFVSLLEKELKHWKGYSKIVRQETSFYWHGPVIVLDVHETDCLLTTAGQCMRYTLGTGEEETREVVRLVLEAVADEINK